jgi:predicted DNA-binding transcriptional regulator AlpA
MVRRLRVESDARQLGLFGEELALGTRPKIAKAIPSPTALVEVTKATIVSKPKNRFAKPLAKPRNLSLLPPEIVRPPEAASLLAVSLSLLKKWRMAGGGPRFVRLGGRAIGYRRVDLLAWVEGLTR